MRHWFASSQCCSQIQTKHKLFGANHGYGALPVTLSRWPLKRVDAAFKAFFRRLKVKRGKAGYPRFRGKSGWRSFGFTEFVGIRLINGRLVVKGLAGGLKLHMAGVIDHRNIGVLCRDEEFAHSALEVDDAEIIA